MDNSDSFPRINWFYIAFVALVATATVVFIAWAVTSQIYREWSHGLPISGGWTWPNVIALDFVCAMLIGALYWKIYCDAKTTIDGNGIYQPSLFGTCIIFWSEVTSVEVFGGFSYHVHAGKRKIVVTPYAYKNPEDVIESLRANMLAAKRCAT
jgi:hypothetical protein